MYCPNCGKPNADGAARCENCLEPLPVKEGAAPAQQQTPPAQPPVFEQPVTYQPPSQPQPAYVQEQQYQPPYGADAQAKPSSFLAGNIIMAVLSLCLCFPLITSIIGIIFGAQVGTKFGVGDVAGARSSSKVAKVLFFVSLGLAVVALIVGVLYISAVVVALEELGDLSQYIY